MPPIKQGEVVDVTELVNARPDDRVELKPDLGPDDVCLECGKRVRMLFPDRKCSKHSAYRPRIAEIQRSAREKIERRANRYADLHYRGAVIAAAKGDTRPSEWALLHGRAVEPVKVEKESRELVVVVGAALPGLPAPSK